MAKPLAVVNTVKVGAFGVVFHPSSSQYSFRIHLWKDTEEAREEVLNLERDMKSALVDVTRSIQVFFGGSDVKIAITNIEPGWILRDEAQMHHSIPLGRVLDLPSNSVTIDLKADIENAQHRSKGPYFNVEIYQNAKEKVSLSVKPRPQEGGIDEQLGVQ